MPPARHVRTLAATAERPPPIWFTRSQRQPQCTCNPEEALPSACCQHDYHLLIFKSSLSKQPTAQPLINCAHWKILLSPIRGSRSQFSFSADAYVKGTERALYIVQVNCYRLQQVKLASDQHLRGGDSAPSPVTASFDTNAYSNPVKLA